MSDAENILTFYDYLHKLKHLRRRGWLLRGVAEIDCENVAGHIFSMSWLAISLLKDFPDLDVAKVLKMCLVHDLGESIIGDITTVDGVSEKDKFLREFDAIKQIFSFQGDTLKNKDKEIINIAHCDDWINLWHEFESKETPESIFVNDIDKLDLLLQAIKYKDKLGDSAFEFIHSALESIKNKNIFDLAFKIFKIDI
ncbi:MAG: HD domain-containing protein [Candidatus Cloacimonetes bacterium]|nr:HD domain-containing protein [Candidatus Cloacimonadota bacterium]